MSKKDALYKYTRLVFVNSTLHNGIFASPINGLNDPYESYGILVQENYRIICLSRSRNKKLMWSHYANGHRGCSIKIAVPDNYGSPQCPLKRVTYSSQILDRSGLCGESLVASFYTKDKKWDYELEVRAVYDKTDLKSTDWKHYRGNVFYKADILQIDFGCFSHYDDHYLDALIAIRDYNANHKKQIKVRKYKMSDRKYEFVIDKSFNYIEEIARITNGEAI